MTVRFFNDADIPAVYAIQLKCPQVAQWREEDYLQLARASGGTILVAEVNEGGQAKLAGFAAFYYVAEEAELRNLAVDPAYQRQGAGRALLAAGIRAMQARGARQLFLEVRASNHPALEFYRMADFQLLHTRREYYQDPVEDALVMGCDITPSPARISGPT
jgi:ribosomal-protein-alanine N-acetyltransferase